MVAVTQLSELLAQMVPELGETEYVFATFPGARYSDLASLMPIASFSEKEGLTLVIERSVAEAACISHDSVYRKISLKVHSSLDAVGLTAALSAALAKQDVPANMFAGYFHDHIFIPSEKAELAMKILLEFR